MNNHTFYIGPPQGLIQTFTNIPTWLESRVKSIAVDRTNFFVCVVAKNSMRLMFPNIKVSLSTSKDIAEIKFPCFLNRIKMQAYIN
jgi:hypothetical protein